MAGHRLNEQRRLFAAKVAETGDPRLAARESGYSSPDDGRRVLGQPAVAAEVIRVSRQRLAEASPIAVATLIELCGVRDTAGKLVSQVVRLGAGKAILDRSIGLPDAAGAAVDPHAMSAAQLAEAIARLSAEVDQREVEANTLDLQPAEAEPAPADEGGFLD